MPAFIKIIGKKATQSPTDMEFTQNCDSYITKQGFEKLSYFVYFSEENISPTIMRTITNSVKGMKNYSKVVKNIYYTTNLSKI